MAPRASSKNTSFQKTIIAQLFRALSGGCPPRLQLPSPAVSSTPPVHPPLRRTSARPRRRTERSPMPPSPHLKKRQVCGRWGDEHVLTLVYDHHHLDTQEKCRPPEGPNNLSLSLFLSWDLCPCLAKTPNYDHSVGHLWRGLVVCT